MKINKLKFNSLKVKALGAACVMMMSDYAASAVALEEVVVTAQRRSENQQDVPISISTISGEDMQAAGMSDISSIGGLTPNATIKNSAQFGGSSSILVSYIRGIGQNDFAFNLEPGVGVYVDGVYLARNIGANVDLLDIQNIEVLKGPQGTLFGRNTIGGALNIVTRDPGDEFKGKVEVSFGADNRTDFRGTVDVPIIEDELSLGVALSTKKRDGYQERIPYTGDTGNNPIYLAATNGAFGGGPNTNTDEYARYPLVSGATRSSESGNQDSITARFKLVWTPNDRFTGRFIGDYQKADEAGTPFSLLNIEQTGLVALYNTCITGDPLAYAGAAAATGLPLAGVTDACANSRGNPVSPNGVIPSIESEAGQHLPYDNRYVLSDPDKSYASGSNFSKVEAWGGNLNLEYALTEDMSLRSITGYRELKSAFGVDFGGAPFAAIDPTFSDDEEQFSEELHLSGLAWEGRWNYLFGAYYFHEEGTHEDGVAFPGGLLQIWSSPNAYETDSYALFTHHNIQLDDNWGITIGMRYTEEDKEFIGSQRDENGLTSRLFGVPPVAFPGGDIFQLYPLDNNKLEFENFSYRVGVEYTFNDDVMTYLSLATGYKGGGWTTRIEAPELTSPTFDEEEAQTIELGVKSELFDGRARVNAAIFHTAYDDLQLTFVEGTSPITANGGDGIIKGAELEVLALISDSWNVDIGVGFLDAEYDSVRPGVARLDGDEDFVNTPEWTAHIGTSYEFMTDSFTVTPRFDWMFQTEVFNNEANDEILKTPSHGIANASVLVKPNDAAWEVQAGVTNAFDKRVIQSGVENGLSIFAGTYNRPREWYLTLRMSF